MTNFYLTRDASVTDDFDFGFCPIPEELAKFLLSWIHEEVPHDFLSVDCDLSLDVDVDIDLDKFKKALLRTFVMDYDFDYIKEYGLDGVCKDGYND